MGKCAIISCAEPFFCKNHDILMAAIVIWLWEGYLIADISLELFMSK